MEGREKKEGEETATGVGAVGGRLSAGVVARASALAVTVAAAVVMGVAKETKIVPIKVLPDLPPFNVPAHAKWTYMSAFVYFVVTNIIACTYAAISLVLTVAAPGKKGPVTLLVLTGDLLMVALLASASGATGAVGVIGYHGNSHVRWNKVCNVFGEFCQHVAAAVLLSLAGAAAFLLLVVLAAVRLHRRSA